MIPSQINAGDTVTWSDSFADYDPAVYTLKYSLRGFSKLDLTASRDGNRWTVTITAAQSSTLRAGVYAYQGWVEKGSGGTYERYTVTSGKLEIVEKLSIASAGHDERGHVRKTLDLLESAIESYAVRPVASISIGGRSLTRPSLAELLQLRSRYLAMLENEKQMERINKGLDAGGRIKVRFGEVS